MDFKFTGMPLQTLERLMKMMLYQSTLTEEQFATFRANMFSGFPRGTLSGSFEGHRIVAENALAAAHARGLTGEQTEELMRQERIAFDAATLIRFNAALAELEDQITCKSALSSIKPSC